MAYILDVERQVVEIEDIVNIDVIVFDTTLIKDSLCGFCAAWKMCYVQKLHQIAKVCSHLVGKTLTDTLFPSIFVSL